MVGRRAPGNAIRGPQSALTDFLASNNISAAQIRNDYERRRRDAEQQAQTEAAENGEEPSKEAEQEEEVAEDSVETAAQKKKRKRQEEKAIAKIKQSKDFKRRKAIKEGEPDGDEEDIAWDMYAKSKPLPGQLENCEICEKRFTVTPYSKAGPDGGLLCPKCSKEMESEKKKEEKAKKPVVRRDKRRQLESNRLEGDVRHGSKTLQELCVNMVAANINDVDEFGDLPQNLMERLSQILSRRRIIDSRTMDLFLKAGADTVTTHDCAKLETEDYIKIFAIAPTVEKLVLKFAGQMKDEVIDYILERDITLRFLQLEAANLISDNKWREFFEKAGLHLDALKLSWLDNSLFDETVSLMVLGCPNLQRLKLKECFHIGDLSVDSISHLTKLEHLSLRLKHSISTTALSNLITSLGPNLRTLSLEKFYNADDTTLALIHSSCKKLSKLRFTHNDYCTDAGYVHLFTNWPNPPLSFVDLNSNRDLDYSNPDGPDAPVGLASDGFKALMAHSGSHLEYLNISSCRHITLEACTEVFDGVKQYPSLREIDLSFVKKVDTLVVAGIFKSCPQIVKVTAFGCFQISDVIVPAGVALIGVPHAQDSIIQEGDGTSKF